MFFGILYFFDSSLIHPLVDVVSDNLGHEIPGYPDRFLFGIFGQHAIE